MAVEGCMARDAEGYQVFFGILAGVPAEFLVVNFQVSTSRRGPTNHGAAHESGKESEPRLTKIEERPPAESREAGLADPRDFLQQLLREAEESVPPEKRGWLGLE